MITQAQIQDLVEQKIAGSDAFIVDVSIRPGNKINVFIDSDNGISIAECVQVSRHIENNLDREQEDFELQVSSPGIDQPLKILRQYLKYIQRQVQVLTKEGQKVAGKLISADNTGIIIEEKQQERVASKKKLIINNLHLTFDKIKETKVVVLFNKQKL